MDMHLVSPWLEQQLVGHKSGITKLCYNTTGTRLASASLDCTVVVWDLNPLARCIRYTAHKGGVLGLSWSPKEELIASTSYDGTTKVWRPNFNATSVTLNYPQIVRAVDFDPTGRLLVTASEGACVTLWDVTRFQYVCTSRAHTSVVRSVKFSPNGELIASGSNDQTLRIFDSRSGQNVRLFAEDLGMGRNVAWHPNGRMVAVALSQGRVKLFDIAENRPLRIYHVQYSEITDLSFHPSGKILLTPGFAGSSHLLDVNTGHTVSMLHAHSDHIMTLQFSQDGSKFATGGCCSEMMLWGTYPKPNLLRGTHNRRTTVNIVESVDAIVNELVVPNYHIPINAFGNTAAATSRARLVPQGYDQLGINADVNDRMNTTSGLNCPPSAINHNSAQPNSKANTLNYNNGC